MATPQVSAGNGVNLIDLANLFGGQKTSTTGSANTSLISALAPQVMNPADPAALIASLFQQAQGQMPALAAARSNAVGGRTGRNSGIVSASDKLLQDTVLKAQQQIMQQEQTRQQIAASLATGLAGATRGQTTQQGTNLGRATGVLGLLSAGSKLADTRIGRKAGDMVSQGFNSLQTSLIGPDTSIPADNFVMESAGNIDPNTYGLDALTQDLSSFGTFGDIGSVVSNAGSTADAGSALFDSGGMSDYVDEFASLIGLADGGLIGRDDIAQRKAMQSYKPKGYADGGKVTGQPMGGRASSVPSYQAPTVQRSSARNMSPLQASGGASPVGMGSSVTDGATGDPSAAVASGPNNGGLTLSNALSLALAVATQNPISLAMALNTLVNNVDAANNAAAGVTDAATVNGMSVVNSDGSIASVPVGAPSSTPAADAIAAANAAADSGAGDGSGGVGAPGTGDSATGGNGGDAAGDGAAGAADGGKINGPGTGISDSIPIKVSKNEYVMPADVVEKLGVAFFDNLRANFHVPAAMQALDTDDGNGDDIG